MRTVLAIATLSFAGLASSTAFAATTDVGSPVIDRNNDDSSAGVIYLYLGGTQPLLGPGTLDSWSFFNNEVSQSGGKVTPLLYEVSGANQWKVVAIGTTRTATSAGVQTHPFAAIAGSAVLDAAKQYTMGFTHRGYTLQGPTVVADGGYGGIVDFVGYGIYTDRWAYAFGTAAMGSILGTGGIVLDSSGFGGRIYSAKFTVNGGHPGPVPYCTSGTSTNGCLPGIGALGSPRVSQSSGFSLYATNVEGAKQGLFFYGVSGRVASTWGATSYLCVKAPTQRMTLLSSGGVSNQCNGSFSTDWLAFVAANPGSLGAPFTAGETINAQAWYRDPAAAKTTNLSNGLEFVTVP